MYAYKASLLTIYFCDSLQIMDPIQLLRDRMKGKTMRELAREIPCSAPYLSDIFNGNRAPGPKILTYLGIEKRTGPEIYRRIRK